MNPELKYKCGECGELHDDEEEAQACCPPHISEVYVCGHCGEYWGPYEDLAEECCEDADPFSLPRATTAELEDAGQIRLGI